MSFRLAPDLELPDRFATEGVVVIGVRGSGKSNTEVRFAELLFADGIPFVAIDPKGDWYGIRMDGTAPGLPVPVFGGLYGDFPLDESLGNRIATLLVDENLSAVLDVSRMSHNARARFLTDFFHQLMDRHQLEPHARCVIFEEAHRYIPQTVNAKQAALKEAAAAVLLEGRSFGLGCWACTQRPARLHNDVLEEVDTAVIHRIGVTATADLTRVRNWVKHEDLGDEIGASLTKLRNGEAWVLSPASLEIVQRVKVDRRTTFDSGATPVVGDSKVVKRRQSTMADIDAGAIKEALADAIEKAKATDPAELTKKIRELERTVKDLRAREPEPVVEKVEVRVPFVPPDALRLVKTIGELGQKIVTASEGFAVAAAKLPEPSSVVSSPPGSRWKAPTPPASHQQTGETSRRAPAPRRTADHRHDAVNEPRQKILDAIAWYNSVGVPRPSRAQVAFVAGTSPSSSGYEKNLGALRTAGLVDYPEPGLLQLTDTGTDIASPGAEITTTEQLIDALGARLGKPKAAILRAAVDAHPDELTREQLAELVRVSPQSSGFEKNVGSLRSLGYLEYPQRGTVRATPILFIDRT